VRHEPKYFVRLRGAHVGQRTPTARPRGPPMAPCLPCCLQPGDRAGLHPKTEGLVHVTRTARLANRIRERFTKLFFLFPVYEERN